MVTAADSLGFLLSQLTSASSIEHPLVIAVVHNPSFDARQLDTKIEDSVNSPGQSVVGQFDRGFHR
jgi:hypothetical protein